MRTKDQTNLERNDARGLYLACHSKRSRAGLPASYKEWDAYFVYELFGGGGARVSASIRKNLNKPGDAGGLYVREKPRVRVGWRG
jgi:hypothetical protein